MNPPPTEQAKAEADAPPALGLYVHVPFCASTCDFCAFYQIRPDAAAVRMYFDGIDAERRLAPPDRGLETLFWGGGTPGLLAPRELARLAAAMPSAGVREWTVELAPASVTPERLQVLRAAGVNRVSLGVQSFSPAWLEALGRMHTRAQVYRAYDRIRQAGFSSVNLDLMFALPGQTAAEWEADVREAVRLAPEHLSTYCLTFEEDTALWVKLAQGRVKLDPEREAELYVRTWDALGAAGYAQYEVSNFARPGHACLHNLNTWRMQEWIGWGPAAASQHGGRRGRNAADLRRWRAGLDRGERAAEDAVALTPELLCEDALIFGLRMNAGVDVGRLRGRDAGLRGKLDDLVADGLAEWAGPRLRLTRRGRLLADRVGAELLGAATGSAPPAY
ncbi:MAG TPA: radical SAM family heme chaperone HemW [Opitutaceae bacterium]|jgi:oxygen-independent coproporphyrinogen-3 oxidase|nr:radical SAM family heme chaperone HemW [Opitutaceae bacterium]